MGVVYVAARVYWLCYLPAPPALLAAPSARVAPDIRVVTVAIVFSFVFGANAVLSPYSVPKILAYVVASLFGNFVWNELGLRLIFFPRGRLRAGSGERIWNFGFWSTLVIWMVYLLCQGPELGLRAPNSSGDAAIDF
jgi:hypothetical protein